MQVLSEAVPMTVGEVYSLLRRRRDERNAAHHPPFGLQPVFADNHVLPPTSTQRMTGVASTSSLGAAVPSLSGAASVLSGRAGSASTHAGTAVTHQSAAMGSIGSYLGGGSVHSRAVPADVLDSAAAAAAASTATLLSAPSSAHLVVLLSEVTVLNYLANHAALMSNTNTTTTTTTTTMQQPTFTLRDVYGPPSVYDRGVAESLPTSGDAASHQQQQQLFSPMESGDLIDATHVSACYAALAGHRPGSKGHVRAATDLLEIFDEAGRAQERMYAAGVRRVVQQLWRQRLWTPDSGAEHASVAGASAAAAAFQKTERNVEESEETWGPSGVSRIADAAAATAATTSAANTHGEAESDVAELRRRKLNNELAAAADANARASVPLLLEPTPLWGSSATTAAVNKDGVTQHHQQQQQQQQQQQARRSLLSESEVMQLVVGRPQTPLDVYRLLDDLDSRLLYKEEAINAFVEGITGVFAKESSAI